ncbi:hypothetical protein LCGC14_3119380 [marine sediment metagenome]|uniref:Uncharacterized protein n=1 Tax=marine sediment metagenome TaxID=412755 RepID=A0A0F8W2P2_9ZZZZ
MSQYEDEVVAEIKDCLMCGCVRTQLGICDNADYDGASKYIFNAICTVVKRQELDRNYLSDVIYCTTQYLDLPDKDVALLNRRIEDEIIAKFAKPEVKGLDEDKVFQIIRNSHFIDTLGKGSPNREIKEDMLENDCFRSLATAICSAQAKGDL